MKGPAKAGLFFGVTDFVTTSSPSFRRTPGSTAVQWAHASSQHRLFRQTDARIDAAFTPAR